MVLKRIRLFIVLVIMMCLCIGCSGGSYKIINGDIKASDNSINGSYGSFTGSYFKKAKFEKDEPINFELEIITVKGKFSAKVIDSKGNIVYEIDKSKIVKMNKSDTYTIQVEGKEHEGGFVVAWNIN